MMKTILTSLNNPEIKNVAKLAMAKQRQSQQRFIAEGQRVVSTLIQSGCIPETIYVTQEHATTLKNVSAEQITIVSPFVMKKISQAKTPSGILAVFHLPKTVSPEKLGHGIVLARIADPGNMGTLIRTAAAMGVHSVVIIDGADPFGPKVVQASAGTICDVTIFIWSWQELLNNKKNMHLCALVVAGGNSPSEIDFSDTLLVVGSEAQGIPDPWLSDCHKKLTIPMPGKTESLNAAVAGSIAMWCAYASKER